MAAPLYLRLIVSYIRIQSNLAPSLRSVLTRAIPVVKRVIKWRSLTVVHCPHSHVHVWGRYRTVTHPHVPNQTIFQKFPSSYSLSQAIIIFSLLIIYVLSRERFIMSVRTEDNRYLNNATV